MLVGLTRLVPAQARDTHDDCAECPKGKLVIDVTQFFEIGRAHV